MEIFLLVATCTQPPKFHHCLCFSKDRPVGREDLITLFEVFTTDSFSALIPGKNQGGQLYGYCKDIFVFCRWFEKKFEGAKTKMCDEPNIFSALRGVNAVRQRAIEDEGALTIPVKVEFKYTEKSTLIEIGRLMVSATIRVLDGVLGKNIEKVLLKRPDTRT